MKNIFGLLKKGFAPVTSTSAAATNPDTVVETPVNHFLPSTPALRESITAFIIQSLQPYIDEKGLSVSELHFYIVCNNREQEETAQLALYTDRPGLFKTEQLERKLLNHFIQLDPAWFFDVHLITHKQLPDKCIRKANFGLRVVRSGEPVTGNYAKASIEVLAGQAVSQHYNLDPQQQVKFNIGRTSTPQLRSGKIQENDIVFLGNEEAGFNETTGGPNLHVSRNHAYIMYEAKTNSWLLYPDRGGLPENGNKLKVHTGSDKVKWLNIYGVPHCLCDGDQIELGGAAVLRFRMQGNIA